MTLLTQPLISVVIAAYNADATIKQTIERLFKQTYQNLEVIVVNDGSTDKTSSTIASLQKKYTQLKLITLNENSGPFKARVIGGDAATGTYLHFLDADDYLSGDFYRSMIQKAENYSSDIVIGSIVLDFQNKGTILDYPLLNDLPFESLEGSESFDFFMHQAGFNMAVHMNSTKIYRLSLWQSIRKYYDTITDHLVMADDIVQNVPLWYFAQRVDRVPSATLFYVKDDNDSATSDFRISQVKIEKNIHDISTAFTFFATFLINQGVEDKYRKPFSNWKKAFIRVYRHNIEKYSLEPEIKEALFNEIHAITPYSAEETWLDSPMYAISTPWNHQYEDVVQQIIANHEVSFSFNTLVKTTRTTNGSVNYLPRSTGQDLLDIARFLKKNITLNIQGSDQKMIIASFNSYRAIPFGKTEKGAAVDLPAPIDIYTKNQIDKYTSLVQYGLSTNLDDVLANYYFDNPYISWVSGSVFNGSPSKLGFALDIDRLTNCSQSFKSVSVIDFLHEVSFDPFEYYVRKGFFYGKDLFLRTTDQFKEIKQFTHLRTHQVQSMLDFSIENQAWADRHIFKSLEYKYPIYKYTLENIKEKKKIRLDTSVIGAQHKSGVATYARTLDEALTSCDIIEYSRVDTPPLPLKAYTKLQSYNVAPPYDSLHRPVDLTIFPNFANWPTVRSGKTATVIHDLTYIKYPDYLEKKNLNHLRRIVPRAIKTSDYIITVSHSVKHEIMHEFGIDESRFIVTPLFATKEFLVKSDLDVFKKYNIPTKKYLYFIGNFEPRKNLLTLIRAYRKLPEEIRSIYSLVIAGGAGWNSEGVRSELDSAKEAGENILHIGYIDQADSPALFQNASLFVFPSEYEGFGIPILEALTSNTPVLCSDIPVFHEVGGLAVEYAKVSSPKDFAHKINEMLTDSKKQLNTAEAQRTLNKYNQTNTLKELINTIYD